MARPSFVLVYIRRDLRLSDHPALYAAAKTGLPVLPLFVYDPSVILGSSEQWWLSQTLPKLPFSVEKGSSEAILKKWIGSGPVEVHFCRGTTPAELIIDKKLESMARQKEIPCFKHDPNLLIEPEEITTQKGTPVKTYSQFAKTVMRLKNFAAPVPKASLKLYQSGIKKESIPKPSIEGYSDHWKVGEDAAGSKWSLFKRSHLSSYSKARDFPAMEGTSHLSPYLHFGEIGVREIAKDMNQLQSAASQKFFSEILWREYAHYLLYYFPTLTKEPFNPKFSKLSWKKSKANLDAWKAGETGVPIVDAGMRCLYETGWMHNRIRMIVASFLTKDLMIHWREGAEWFEEMLVDADLANNRMNWQWVSGCGIDAAPYFRIFNPYLQSKKFDPEGEYIRRWVPEIAHLSNNDIHTPHLARDKKGKYPHPLVDHNEARKEALARFKAVSQ